MHVAARRIFLICLRIASVAWVAQCIACLNQGSLLRTTSAATTVAPSGPSRVFIPLNMSAPLYGVLQPDSKYEVSTRQAGLLIRTLEIGWNLYEPQEGTWNSAYVRDRKAAYQQIVNRGFLVILDLGIQYPPDWIFHYPNSHFINQYGEAFGGGLGINGINSVFNQAIRDRQARYVQQVFNDFGTGFYAVRLGWGSYNELTYPPATYNNRSNTYWAYDAIAQGKAAGLPDGMRAAPTLGWKPGEPSVNHAPAAAFINWYMDSLKNYHDWQIRTVRQFYSGQLMMLYPSWGVRPGELDAAIAVDLNGTTSPEINGEIQRGLDVARFVNGITDHKLMLYTTWLEASDKDDELSDPTHWSPAHYLTSLADANPVRPGVWGESSGHNSYEDMRRCFKQLHAYKLQGMVWAFEQDLYSGQYATINNYSALIGGSQ